MRDLEREAAVALTAVEGMNPARLRAIREAFGFQDGWHRLLERRLDRHPRTRRCLGDRPDVTQEVLARSASTLEPSRLLDAHRRAGIDTLLLGDDRYPAALAADLEPPAVLYARGELDVIPGPRVGVVGTRRCTRTGRLVALDLGRGLAAAGVRVVSGLALGIDGAAHQGALDHLGEGPAPVVGVVGSGLDVVYPRRHAGLWDAVAGRGVLLSEWPLGSRGLAWRFPLRNRIIAALSDLVVVVESHVTGGALNTAGEVVRRGRDVLVVPGSVRSPASAGTNALLFDGAGPARDVDDVLVALGFAAHHPEQLSLAELDAPAGPDRRVDELTRDDADLLDLIGGEPCTLDQLASTSRRPLGELAIALLRFEQHGWVARSGAWIERIGP